MKKQQISIITFLFISLLSILTLYDHTPPEKLIYQAEARDSDGKPNKKATLTVKITIFAGVLSGPIVWEGDHVVTTDRYGLFTLAIGEGTGGGTPPFSAIDWANDTYFLNVHVNDEGSWVDMGTTQFLSVPYALHAKTVENITETDPVIQQAKQLIVLQQI